MANMTFFEHIDALRPHLIRCAGAVILLAIGAFTAKTFLIDTLLLGPLSPEFPTNRVLNNLAVSMQIDALRVNLSPPELINTTLAGQFNLHMKISFVAALVLAVPYMLWEVWQFVKPALTSKERRGSRHFILYVSLCFITGLLFGYFIIAPLAINFLTGYRASTQITNLIDINSYLSTIINVTLACGAVFQLPLLVTFLTRIGLITDDFLRRYRRHALVVLAIFSAVITPPDAFSMVLVLLPLYGLYEYSIRIAARIGRRKALQENN